MQNKGFTLVETLVAVFLILIVFSGIFTAYQLGLRVIGQNKNRITAIEIANGEIEKIRNTPYRSIGITGGYPSGDLPALKTVVLNSLNYSVETRIDYVIDAADGISSPADDCPNDYKKVEIKVFWSGILGGEVKLTADISPESLIQECAETGGILSVQVFDAYGVMVVAPLIEVKNPTTDENIRTATPAEGRYFFSLPASNYKVVVSKNLYSTARTYGIDEVANPENSHPFILEGLLTENSFSIDKLSSITVETKGPEELGYPIIENVSFNLRGAKLIGTDSQENPVYKYSQNHINNELGQIDISDLEWDSYIFSILTPGLNLTEPEQPVSLPPDVHQDIQLILEAENSLLATVSDSDTGLPVFSAEVKLDINTQYTGEDGKTYFIPLSAGTYNLEVNASGYTSYSGPVSVSGGTTQTVSLQRIE